VTWALSECPKEINIISSWASDLGYLSADSVPTVLTYDSQGTVTSWGYKLDRNRHHLSHFKLLLCQQETQRLVIDHPKRFQQLQCVLEEFHKEPVDVVADYLRCLWAHATENIERVLVKAFWENISVRVVLTVPEMWDQAAQGMMKTTVRIAGILDRSGTTLQLISEPEATATAFFADMSWQKTQNLQVRGKHYREGKTNQLSRSMTILCSASRVKVEL
jgi:molecular chaperone DnaK (HSP70)